MTDANQTAACCANFYEQDFVQEMMGGSFHPGGIELSRTLVASLSLAPGSKTVDVACGIGTTTRMMAQVFGLDATGIDFSHQNIRKAALGSPAGDAADQSAADQSAADQPCCGPGEICCDTPETVSITTTPGRLCEQPTGNNTADSVTPGSLTFAQGSADQLPFDDATLDGITCECAVSTFVDQKAVACEFSRVLKPGGVFGMTDMVVTDTLPDDFMRRAAPWTCVARALSVDQYKSLFQDAGMELVEVEDHSGALIQLATEMKRKLVMSGFSVALGAMPSLQLSLSDMRALLKQSTDLVRAGKIQYQRFLFRKP